MFAVKISVGGTLDGTTPLAPPAGGFPPPGADGVIDISVAGNLGLIDPDFSNTQDATTVPLLLQSIHVKMSSTGDSSSTVDLVDADGNLAMQLLDLNAVTVRYSDSRRVIPPGYRLRIVGQGTGGHIVRMALWPITRAEQVAALP
jgi:hypothetical protein